MVEATEDERLEKSLSYSDRVTSLLETNSDWPSFRKDNQGSVTINTVISKKGSQLWRFPSNNVHKPVTDILGHAYYTAPTAPVTADGLVFYSGSEGIVRALDVVTGNLLWTAYTGGSVRISPTICKGRVFVGSGDGWVYCFKARTGELLWRFRAAPVERKIPVYGSLQSTWPAASGVLVENGIAYVAAGIVNYDGTHVYALDAETGEINWQNNSSGHLYPEARTGVSVQGHMLLHNGKLYIASGTSLSPAVFDISTGKCLNDPEPLKKCMWQSPRGWELYLIGDKIVAGGQPYYRHPKQSVYNIDVSEKILHASNDKRDIIWVNQKKVICSHHINKQLLNDCVLGQMYSGYRAPIWQNLKPVWEYNCEGSTALAVCNNAVVVAEKSQIVVLDIQNGKILWSHPLMYSPVPWGLAVGRDGRIIVTLEDGSVRCFGGESTLPVPFLSSKEKFLKESTRVVLACDTQGAEIRYTLDGSEPTQNSMLYTKPFVINNSTTLLMRAYSKHNDPGFVILDEFKKVDYSLANDPTSTKIGLEFDYYEDLFSFTKEMDEAQPRRSGVATRVEYEPYVTAEKFGYIFRGFILIPEDGTYTFYINSNDGSKLYINDQELIDNDSGRHAAIEHAGTISLKAGEYPFMVKYFQMEAAKALQVSWDGPGFSKKELTAEFLFHKESPKLHSSL